VIYNSKNRKRLKRLITIGNKRIVILAVLCFAVLSIVSGVIYKVSGNRPQKTLLKIMDSTVDLQVMNVHYTEATDEGVKWEIKADSAQYRKKENLAVFKNPCIKLIMPNGRVYVMTGSEGFVHQDSKDMEISGNINLTSSNGDEFKTNHLSYSGIEKRCYTPAPVTMKNSRIQVDAKGMSLSLKDEQLTLLSGVRAVLN